MDGIHDLGGRQGFGPVELEADEPVFHARWEGRVFASMGAMLVSAGVSTPAFRHAIERMDPGHYLTASYYEHWLTAAATLAVESGLISVGELTARAGAFPLARPSLVTAADAAGLDLHSSARFSLGDSVVVREDAFSGHTRCPAYVQGRRGVVVALGPTAHTPEAEAHRGERLSEATYTVGFRAGELWPGTAEPDHTVHVDLYDHHLDAAGSTA